MPKSYWPDKFYRRSGGFTTPPESGSSAPGPLPQRRLRWAFTFGLMAVVLVGALISAAVVELPYYALRPGTVRDSGAVVTVEGAPVYEPDGTINFTTVSIRPVNTLELIMAWLDEDVDLQPREEILGDRSPDENRRENLHMMDTSQQDATYVALDTLGYEVDVTLGGELVHQVAPDLAAAGVLDPGDVIVEIDGEAIDEPHTLERLLSARRPGDEINLTVRPLAESGDLGPAESRSLTLVADPADEERAIMGITVIKYDLVYDFPVDVTFDTGEVGGPSAGLAFTLTVIDLLTEGELTGGLDIAVTGTIRVDGSVGTVGGTAQKAAAARSDGMDVFLVPAEGEDYENTIGHAGDVRVIQVGTVEDALEALEDLGGDGIEQLTLTP